MLLKKNTKVQLFADLHHKKEPFILANAWDAASARAFEKAGFSAIGTTSAGIAASRGYSDGQNIPLAEMLDSVRQILLGTTLPVSVDIEAGFGKNHEEVVQVLEKLISLGAVGINLEDGTWNEACPITPLEEQVNKIRTIRDEISSEYLWINARVDVFYLGLLEREAALKETIKRANAYLEAGANSIFVVVNDRDVISTLIREIKAPINLLANSKLPPIPELKELGVSRVSLGSAPMRATLGLLKKISRELLDFGTYESLTNDAVSYSDLQKFFNE
jgi:2-methylisocitrate lyase-like PEP mutase family enzyme